MKGEIFTTERYDKKLVRYNSYICFETECSVAYGKVLCFFKENQVVNCLIEKFRVDQRKLFSHSEGKFTILHLIPVCEAGLIISIPASAIMSKHARVCSFLCIRPNTHEKYL